ncbi:MAG TPA: hypothetical protein VEY68_09435 [Anoxybacillus sp.]|nr:hypothetical protein [Anoxybacillus vitaminiphilus]MCZ0756684.1 hypothetical protein [Anoxybacillus sp. J5B_2022]HZG60671.1 hypothetical protein [Anoxybacillus sp.]
MARLTGLRSNIIIHLCSDQVNRIYPSTLKKYVKC